MGASLLAVAKYIYYIAHSIKVTLGVGNCALPSYCLVVAQENHCGGLSMFKIPMRAIVISKYPVQYLSNCVNLYPKDDEIGFPKLIH